MLEVEVAHNAMEQRCQDNTAGLSRTKALEAGGPVRQDRAPPAPDADCIPLRVLEVEAAHFDMEQCCQDSTEVFPCAEIAEADEALCEHFSPQEAYAEGFLHRMLEVETQTAAMGHCCQASSKILPCQAADEENEILFELVPAAEELVLCHTGGSFSWGYAAHNLGRKSQDYPAQCTFLHVVRPDPAVDA